MNNKEFIYSLVVLGFILICLSLLISSQVSASITTTPVAGKNNLVKVKGCDYLGNFTFSLFRDTGGAGLWNSSFNQSFQSFNNTLLIGTSARSVNTSIVNDSLYVQIEKKNTNTTWYGLFGTKSGFFWKNVTIYFYDKSGKIGSLLGVILGGSGRIGVIEDCYIKNMNGSAKGIGISLPSKTVQCNDTILDGVYIQAGNWYCRNVIVQNVMSGTTVTVACTGVVYSYNLILKNNYFGYQIGISQFNISDAFFIGNTYDVRFASTANRNLYMFNCTFDRAIPNVYTTGSTFTGKLHFSYGMNWTVKNETDDYVHDAWIRMWNKTGSLVKNVTFDGNTTFRVDTALFNASFVLNWNTPWSVNITNWNKRSEYENFSFNNSLSKVREIVYLVNHTRPGSGGSSGGSVVHFYVNNTNPANTSNDDYNVLNLEKIDSSIGIEVINISFDFWCDDSYSYKILTNATYTGLWYEFTSDFLPLGDSIVFTYLYYRLGPMFITSLSPDTTYYWRIVILNATSVEVYNETFWFHTANTDPLWYQMGFDAENIFLFVWILFAAAILFGKNAWEWIFSSLALLFIGLAGYTTFIPATFQVWFGIATVFVAIIGIIRFIYWGLTKNE